LSFIDNVEVVDMSFEDCIQFMERNVTCFLATVEGEKPHVRPMTVWLADNSGIYFYTSTVKPLASQLLKNTNVEVAFHQPGISSDPGKVLRIAGSIQTVEHMDIRKKLWDKFPWLNEIGAPADATTIMVFRIPSGWFNFWTWENNVSPGPWVQFP
jgi:pyridoxamine 5'-phosphate oxidase